MYHSKHRSLPSGQRRLACLAAAACGTLLLASTAHAITCPATSPPPGAPVAVSIANKQYFTYKGQLLPLLGISHEYTCHIPQDATHDAWYCTLGNYPSVLQALKNNKNNVVRLWTIFNHSPGYKPNRNPPRYDPFTNEQPFRYNEATRKWDLRAKINNSNNLNDNYLANLESVVCDAYNKNIVVEVSLLDPWQGEHMKGPFHSSNTVTFFDPVTNTNVTPGFAQEYHFLTYESPSTKTDVTRAAQIARQAQKDAIAAIVNRLKKYPNIIWEVANEPDFLPSGTTLQNVFDVQKDMLAVIQANDTTHPIMINGHTGTTFAWNTADAKAASLHYTHIPDANYYGAIELQRASTLTAARANVPLAFNENRFVPSSERTVDAIRSEAWEFMLNEGGLFDAYSLDRSAPAAQQASIQFKALSDFLVAPSIVGGIPTYIWDLASMQQTSCNGVNDWCTGLPAYGTSDQGTCTTQAANVYWATMKSDTSLAVYIHHATQLSGTFGGYAAKLCGTGTTGSGYSANYPSAIGGPFRFRVPQPGCWSTVWIDPATKTKISGGLTDLVANTWYQPSSYPYYKHDIVFLASLWRAGSCY
ncbi:MAG TPA: cellulase family glycosylhydrolase [Thermoanaerobaculia bacterium]|nr:cellulase family glycosylhydrolase [Thermoanaerobaculia bacterium]